MSSKLLLTATAATLTGLVFAAPFTTKKFEVDVTVQKNGTVNVHETISVDFLKPQHGILRTFPANNVSYDFHGVKLNGRSVAWAKSTGDMVTLKVGRANRTIRGNAVYELSYSAEGAIDSDNVLGWKPLPTSWPTPIDTAKVDIHFPKGALVSKRIDTQETILAFDRHGRDELKFHTLGSFVSGSSVGLRLKLSPAKVRVPVNDRSQSQDSEELPSPVGGPPMDSSSPETSFFAPLLLLCPMFFLIFIVVVVRIGSSGGGRPRRRGGFYGPNLGQTNAPFDNTWNSSSGGSSGGADTSGGGSSGSGGGDSSGGGGGGGSW